MFGVKQLTASWNWPFKTNEEGKCPGPGQTSDSELVTEVPVSKLMLILIKFSTLVGARGGVTPN